MMADYVPFCNCMHPKEKWKAPAKCWCAADYILGEWHYPTVQEPCGAYKGRMSEKHTPSVKPGETVEFSSHFGKVTFTNTSEYVLHVRIAWGMMLKTWDLLLTKGWKPNARERT